MQASNSPLPGESHRTCPVLPAANGDHRRAIRSAREAPERTQGPGCVLGAGHIGSSAWHSSRLPGKSKCSTQRYCLYSPGTGSDFD